MWNTHIEQTAAKGNKKLDFLKRNLKINNPDIKSCNYKTLVRPILQYYITVWIHILLNLLCMQLEKIQCQTARWVKNNYTKQSSVTHLLIDLQWRDLAQRQTDARLSLMYKIVYNLILIEAIKYFKLQ